MKTNCTTRWLNWIRKMVKKYPERTLEDLVCTAVEMEPALALDVMEDIGSHPSSEPELAMLQRVWK